MSATATRKRVRGYKEWNPRAEAQVIMRQVVKILDEYAAHLPLSLRQIFYRLVGAYLYEKTELAYGRLGEMLNRARREPRDKWWKVDWDAVRDDGVINRPYRCYENAEEFLETVRYAASRFQLDLMSRQAVHLEIICEAGGMVPQLAAIAAEYGIGVSSCGGFDSSQRKHDLALRLSRTGKPVQLLHIGDYDPSGVHIAKNLDEDVDAFLDYYGGDVTLSRLAVTPEQKEQFDLPTAPPKAKDNRSFDSDYTVQAEALDPADLAAIVKEGIESRIDLDILAEAREEEKHIREELVEKLEATP